MTEKEFWNLINKKAESEFKKDLIRKTYAPQIADLLCRAIDAKEHADLFEKLYKEWLEYQKHQSDIIHTYLKTMGM